MSDTVLYIHPVAQAPLIWGMSLSERIQKQCQKKKLISKSQCVDSIAELAAREEKTALIMRGDCAYDDAVIAGLLGKTDIILVNDKGNILGAHVAKDKADTVRAWLDGALNQDAVDINGFDVITPEQAGGAYRDELRKREAPYALIVSVDGDNATSTAHAIEWRLYKGSYKGVTDLVTKYVWPVPAFHVTKLCAKYKFSPNMVTTVGAILMLLALYLFWQGHYATGLLAGWVMTFLDTVDGKLARVTLTSSKFGNIFDHGIDLIHPPFWYLAWGYGLYLNAHMIDLGRLETLVNLMFYFYILGRLCEGYFIWRFGVHIHVWRRIDSWFRLISSRRNPNMIILSLYLFIGRPDIGFTVIVMWSIATFVIHIVQIIQAEFSNRKAPLRSWLRPA